MRDAEADEAHAGEQPERIAALRAPGDGRALRHCGHTVRNARTTLIGKPAGDRLDGGAMLDSFSAMHLPEGCTVEYRSAHDAS